MKLYENDAIFYELGNSKGLNDKYPYLQTELRSICGLP